MSSRYHWNVWHKNIIVERWCHQKCQNVSEVYQYKSKSSFSHIVFKPGSQQISLKNCEGWSKAIAYQGWKQESGSLVAFGTGIQVHLQSERKKKSRFLLGKSWVSIERLPAVPCLISTSPGLSKQKSFLTIPPTHSVFRLLSDFLLQITHRQAEQSNRMDLSTAESLCMKLCRWTLQNETRGENGAGILLTFPLFVSVIFLSATNGNLTACLVTVQCRSYKPQDSAPVFLNMTLRQSHRGELLGWIAACFVRVFPHENSFCVIRGFCQNFVVVLRNFLFPAPTSQFEKHSGSVFRRCYFPSGQLSCFRNSPW